MNTAQEQFIEDYTLVVDNSAPAYFGHLNLAKCKDAGAVGEQLQHDFEAIVSQVADLAREKGLTVGADIISQMLIGYGADTFYKLGKHYVEMAGE